MPIVLALPEIGLIAAAIFALLVIFGFEILRRVNANTLSRLPVIGGAIAGMIDGLLTDAYNLVSGWLHTTVQAMSHLWDAIFAPVASIVEELVHGIESAASFAARVTLVYIPHAIAAAVSIAEQLVGAAEARVTGALDWLAAATVQELAQLRTQLAAGIAWAAGAAWSAVQQLRAEVQTALGTMEGTVSDVIARLRADAFAAVAQVAHDAAAQVAGVEARAATAFTALEGWAQTQLAAVGAYAEQAAVRSYDAVFRDLAHEVHDTLAQEWDKVLAPAEAVAVALPSAIPGVLDRLESIPQAIPADVPAALAALAAISIPLSTYVQECGIPLCRNLGKVGNQFSDLFRLIEDGAVLEFIAYAATHPKDMARDADRLLAPIGHGIVDAVHGVVGG